MHSCLPKVFNALMGLTEDMISNLMRSLCCWGEGFTLKCWAKWQGKESEISVFEGLLGISNVDFTTDPAGHFVYNAAFPTVTIICT